MFNVINPEFILSPEIYYSSEADGPALNCKY